MKRRVAGMALASLIASCGGLRAAEPPWPAGTYDYVIVDQDLRDVLQEFGANTKLNIALTEKVQGHAHGPLPFMSPRQFLDSITRQYGLEWVYDGSLITVSATSESQTELIPLRNVSFDQLHAGLSDAGLIDPRFQFKAAMDGRAALVSGPPRYLGLVRAGLATIQAKGFIAGSMTSTVIGMVPRRLLTVMRGEVTSTVQVR